MAAGGMGAEIMIEADDAVHLGPRQVQGFGQYRLHLVRHIAEALLHGMQDRQQGTFEALEFGDDRLRARNQIIRR